jgi:hypothetical protein
VRSDFAKNLLLAAVSGAVCLGAAEAGARWFLPEPARLEQTPVFGTLHRPDPLIGWVMGDRPISFRHRLTDDHGVLQYDVVYSVAGGTRLTSKVAHDGPALIATGCSFMFGHGVKDEDTAPWILQEDLPQYRVINAAVMGYGTDQALLAAERQIERNPGRSAAVVLGFGDFQVERNRSAQGWLVHVYPFSKPLYRVTPNGAEYQRQVRYWTGGALALHSDLFAHAINTFANRANGIASHEQARELTADIIISFAKRFQAAGIRFAVVTMPYLGDQGPAAHADREFVVERLRASRIPVLEPEFPRGKDGGIEGRDFMVSRIDRHPNGHYNAMLTAQILPFLRANGIVAP